MPELEFSPTAQQWTNAVLIWLGFGILTGLLAKALIPGREPGGPVGTLVIGILGSVLGPLALSQLWQGRQFNPLGPAGILAAVASAVVLLVVYRVLLACLVPRQPDQQED